MRPKCSICKNDLSTGASISGTPKYFCINSNCPDRFKTIDIPVPDEVIRVNGSVICTDCEKPFREHPQDLDYPWPTFVLLCDGTHAKV